MKKKLFFEFFLFVVLATFMTFPSCKNYDDNIKNLKTALSILRSTVDEMQQKIENDGTTIIGVETTANGITIKLSDGKTYTLTNGTAGKDGSVITIGENGNWFIDSVDTGKASKGATGDVGAPGAPGGPGASGKDGIYYTPCEDGFWHKHDGETVTPTEDSWITEGEGGGITAKWIDGYVVLYNVEGSDEPITIGLVGINNLVLIPDCVTDNDVSVLNFSSLVTSCGEIAPATLVKYQISPVNATEKLIDKENLYFKYNNPTILSRALDLNPKAEFVSLENGVLTVKTFIDANALKELEGDDKITQLMLIVPTTSGNEVVSDWAKVATIPLGKVSLLRVPTNEEGDVNWSKFKLNETLDDAKNLPRTDSTVVDLASNESLNLLGVVKTMVSEKSPWSDFNIDRYNLKYTFDLNDEEGNKIVYKLGEDGTDQQEFIDLTGSEVSVINTDGTDIRTPIVHVMLTSKDYTHECNVLEGFIKINITESEGEPSDSIKPIGEWLFNDSDNLLKATIGLDLELVGIHKKAKGPMPDNGAVTIGVDGHYIVNHGIEPEKGQKYVNQYSIVYDIKVDDFDNWKALFQTDPKNSGDADLYIRENAGTVGVAQTGYSVNSVTLRKWHRLALVVNNGVEYSLYLDGVKILWGNVQEVDDERFGLRPTFILFGDGGGYDDDVHVAKVSLYDKPLTADDVYKLGKIETEPIVPPVAPSPVGEWLFNNPSNLLKATVGSNLELVGNHKITEGPMPDNGAVTIGVNGHYKVNHTLQPGVGQKYVNEYSIVYDIKADELIPYIALLQTDAKNSNDADVYLKGNGTVGVATTGYSSTSFTVKAGQWHRLILSVNNGVEYSLYLDGIKTLTGNVQSVDGRFSLGSSFLLFADGGGYDGDINVARVSLYDKAMTADDVYALGTVEVPYNPFLTTPYLQNVTKTGITIMWESKEDAPGKVYYGIDDNFKNEVTASVTATNASTYVNKAIIKDLSAETNYKYLVTQSGAESKKQSFKTAPDNDNANFSATVWADSHYPEPWSKMVNYMITEVQPDLALNAGDLCNNGKRSDLSTVFLPHVCEGIGSHVPFYSALGNHDMQGGELIRLYHDQPKEVNSDPGKFKGSYLMMYSNVAFIFIDWNRMGTDLVRNGWFEQTLQSEAVKNARFRFVFIHCPPYMEVWQVAELYIVKNNLSRIAEENSVDAVFSGHSHMYERGVKNGVQYLTVGGASYLNNPETDGYGPIIYDHIIRGYKKPGDLQGFYNGLRNHFAELKIEGSKAEIKIHYFNPQGTHEGVIESIFLNK